MNYEVRPTPSWLLGDSYVQCSPRANQTKWICISASTDVVQWLSRTFEFNEDYRGAGDESYDILVTPEVFTILSLKWQR